MVRFNACTPSDSVRSHLFVRAVPVLIAVVVVMFQRCSAEKFTNETGRTARVSLSREQESALGIQAYREVLSSQPTVRSGPEYELVRRCAARLAAATGDAGRGFSWEVSLIDGREVNAFCLPGGKIAVYRGILPVARSEAGLAVVMGHEMAHATLRHGSERILQQQSANTILTGVNFSTMDMDYGQRRMILGALGAGAQMGFLLPFSRDHESEADKVGLRYMAKAGYDPQEAIPFWQRMGEASAGRRSPPEFASTHPSHETRIQRLKAELPAAMEIYRANQTSPEMVQLERSAGR
jgi:metalloendopeptidase OMA1, mitochondrial